MDKVVIDREVYEKVMNAVAQMPYAQVAGLMQEAQQSARLVQEDESADEVKEDDEQTA